MLESIVLDLPQFDVYHNSLKPISSYYEAHKNYIPLESDIQKLIPYAKQTNFILTTFLDIIDDLNYNKEKFENIIFTLDDDYDMLKKFISKLNPNIKSHKELLKISDSILTNLIKVQNELGIIISQNENNRV